MKPIPLPEQAYLNECLDYDPLTGELTWKIRPRDHFISNSSFTKFNNQFAGKTAFTSLDGEGYLYRAITIKGQRKFYKAHRIIWKLIYGYDPLQIDHENRIRHDNRLSNLINSSSVANARNRKKRIDNSSGHTGIQITPNGKFIAILGSKHLGVFNTLTDALAKRKRFANKAGYHPNHGT